jgi:hypothetical protein
MGSSATDITIAAVSDVTVTDEFLTVGLDDGRRVSIPLSWYPRLFHANASEREEFRLIGAGEGIHWDRIDEDISAESIIAGRRSQESQASLEMWLKRRSG